MKILILNSGGIDSTTCLAMAIEKYGVGNVATLCFIYGQRHLKEIEQAKKIADYYQVQNYVIDLTSTGIFRYSGCSLLERNSKGIEYGTYGKQIGEQGIIETYVPFRNGLMLASAASFAMGLYENMPIIIYLGVHADDMVGSAYADCSPDFVNSMKAAIYHGTYGMVELFFPLIHLNKTEVVKIGHQLKAPYELTWSCYFGKEPPCMQCATCLDRKIAFENNGLEDPAL